MYFGRLNEVDHTQYPVGKPLLRGSIRLSKPNFGFRISDFGFREFENSSCHQLFNTRNREIRNPKSEIRNSLLHQQSRYQLRSSLDAKFDKDVAQVELHSLFTNIQPASDLSVGQSFHAAERHLGFSAT